MIIIYSNGIGFLLQLKYTFFVKIYINRGIPFIRHNSCYHCIIINYSTPQVSKQHGHLKDGSVSLPVLSHVLSAKIDAITLLYLVYGD